MRVACLMMQKDESDLLDPWLAYHAQLFGAENMFVWDNGSTDPSIGNVLAAWKDRVGELILDRSTPTDFRRKGVILGEKIKALDSLKRYDYFFPIDCDEFLVSQSEGVPQFGLDAICRELEMLGDQVRALGIGSAFYNLPGKPDQYWKVGFRKTFFRAGTFKQMDHGYHQGESCLALGIQATNLAYMHLHHKPHAQIREHSLNKLAPYYDVNDQHLMLSLYNSNRLVRFVMDSEEQYLSTFANLPSTFIPEFRQQFESLGVKLPDWI